MPSLCDQNCGVQSVWGHTDGQTEKWKQRDIRSCIKISAIFILCYWRSKKWALDNLIPLTSYLFTVQIQTSWYRCLFGFVMFSQSSRFIATLQVARIFDFFDLCRLDWLSNLHLFCYFRIIFLENTVRRYHYLLFI